MLQKHIHMGKISKNIEIKYFFHFKIYPHLLDTFHTSYLNPIGSKRNISTIARQKKNTLNMWGTLLTHFPAGNYMFKVYSRNTRTTCEVCFKLTVKTSERHHWCRSGVFSVNFEHILHIVLVFLLLTFSYSLKTLEKKGRSCT